MNKAAQQVMRRKKYELISIASQTYHEDEHDENFNHRVDDSTGKIVSGSDLDSIIDVDPMADFLVQTIADAADNATSVDEMPEFIVSVLEHKIREINNIIASIQNPPTWIDEGAE